MNAEGEAVDSKQVESGYGEWVKDLGGWEGEITGKLAAGSKFTQLQIGMSIKQVSDLAGQATDQGAHMTWKAWISFYLAATGIVTKWSAKAKAAYFFLPEVPWGILRVVI